MVENHLRQLEAWRGHVVIREVASELLMDAWGQKQERKIENVDNMSCESEPPLSSLGKMYNN